MITREERARPDVRGRFMTRFTRGEGCWTWNGTRSVSGYGVIQSGRMQFKAHRLAYFYTYGPIAPGLHVRHTCDNPICVRPDHLRVGTALDNNRDKVARSRQARGARVNTARLTAPQVRENRRRLQLGEKGAAIAEEFGIGTSTVYHIRDRHTWRHV